MQTVVDLDTLVERLVEGNDLLRDDPASGRLRPAFDVTVFLDVPEPALETRLGSRWLG